MVWATPSLHYISATTITMWYSIINSWLSRLGAEPTPNIRLSNMLNGARNTPWHSATSYTTAMLLPTDRR